MTEKWRPLDFTDERLTTKKDLEKRAENRKRIEAQKDTYKAPKIISKKAEGR